MFDFIHLILTYSPLPVYAHPGMAWASIIAIVAAIVSAAVSATTAGISAKTQQNAAKAQQRGANIKSRHEQAVALVENEQKRQSAATEVEEASIKGARTIGAARALGVSQRSLERLTRDAKAMTLRDIGDIEKGFDFARQATSQSQTAIEINRRLEQTQARAGSPSNASIGLGIGAAAIDAGLNTYSSLKFKTDEQQTPKKQGGE